MLEDIIILTSMVIAAVLGWVITINQLTLDLNPKEEVMKFNESTDGIKPAGLSQAYQLDDAYGLRERVAGRLSDIRYYINSDNGVKEGFSSMSEFRDYALTGNDHKTVALIDALSAIDDEIERLSMFSGKK